jgi:hypothetical protein
MGDDAQSPRPHFPPDGPSTSAAGPPRPDRYDVALFWAEASAKLLASDVAAFGAHSFTCLKLGWISRMRMWNEASVAMGVAGENLINQRPVERRAPGPADRALALPWFAPGHSVRHWNERPHRLQCRRIRCARK